MAYLWSDKITDYYYSNPELDTVAVMWTDPDDKLTREHYIKVDESDEQWRDFVAEVSYEKIDERTMVRHEQFREQFREAFNNYAQTHDVNQNVDQTIQPANFEDIIINFINDFDVTNVEHKEHYSNLNSKYLNWKL
jgi:hypothetical protein